MVYLVFVCLFKAISQIVDQNILRLKISSFRNVENSPI